MATFYKIVLNYKIIDNCFGANIFVSTVRHVTIIIGKTHY